MMPETSQKCGLCGVGCDGTYGRQGEPRCRPCFVGGCLLINQALRQGEHRTSAEWTEWISTRERRS